MTGTEDRTMKAFYLNVDENKIRHETQGLGPSTVPFYKWADLLHRHSERRYENLKYSSKSDNI